MQSVFLAVFLGLGFEGCMHPVASGRGGSNPLSRSYGVGDRERYEMTASHEDPRGVLRYSAVAATTAVRDTGGHFVENVDWSAAIVNGSRTALTPATSQAVQWVTLDTAVIPRIPNLQAAHPSLIGPMLDLMTFYVDLQLAAKQPSLRRAGDRQYVHVNTPASWADGRQVIRRDPRGEPCRRASDLRDHGQSGRRPRANVHRSSARAVWRWPDISDRPQSDRSLRRLTVRSQPRLVGPVAPTAHAPARGLNGESIRDNFPHMGKRRLSLLRPIY